MKYGTLAAFSLATGLAVGGVVGYETYQTETEKIPAAVAAQSEVTRVNACANVLGAAAFKASDVELALKACPVSQFHIDEISRQGNGANSVTISFPSAADYKSATIDAATAHDEALLSQKQQAVVHEAVGAGILFGLIGLGAGFTVGASLRLTGRRTSKSRTKSA